VQAVLHAASAWPFADTSVASSTLILAHRQDEGPVLRDTPWLSNAWPLLAVQPALGPLFYEIPQYGDLKVLLPEEFL